MGRAILLIKAGWNPKQANVGKGLGPAASSPCIATPFQVVATNVTFANGDRPNSVTLVDVNERAEY